jgi:gluconate 2-dehydrogenase alpha chain
MSQVIQHPSVDVVVLGVGAMGGLIATELAMAGYKVVGLERGPKWDFYSDFYATKYDEWGIGFMRKFSTNLRMNTPTLRNNKNQFALPVRRNTPPPAGQSTSTGYGVGGACQHYAGMMGRYGPWVYEMYSQTVDRYGLDFLNKAVPHQDITDWPLTYNDYVPYYETWEQMWGVCGTNEGPLLPSLTSYPLPPAPDTPIGVAYKDATTALGYNPYPQPHALASKGFVNQYGVAVQQCAYDGWCGAICNYECETGAKANTDFRVIPAALKTGNLDLRIHSWVFRLDTDSSGKITAVRYYDSQGNINVQPATVFVNCLWGFNAVRLMLNSGIGEPYNPITLTGSMGRGPAMGDPGAAVRTVTGTVDYLGGNAYPCGNAEGGAYAFRELADDNFDHTGLDFIGGAYVFPGAYAGGGPTNFYLYAANPSMGNVGGNFKASIKDAFLPTKTHLAFSPYGMWPPTTDWFFDLDPHYNDKYGDPLARVTLDWGMNTVKCANYLAPKYVDIMSQMGASNVQISNNVTTESHTSTWIIHIRGGARLGTDPAVSVFNKWQQCWTSENLFAAGEFCNPTGTNTTIGGTHPIGPTSYVASEGIKKYLKSPGPLV